MLPKTKLIHFTLKHLHTKKGFTLIEVLVGSVVFLVVMGLVSMSLVQTFRSFQAGQKFQGRQLRQRACLFHMGKEIASLVKVFYPSQNYNFKAKEDSFFLSLHRSQAWESQNISVIYLKGP